MLSVSSAPRSSSRRNPASPHPCKYVRSNAIAVPVSSPSSSTSSSSSSSTLSTSPTSLSRPSLSPYLRNSPELPPPLPPAPTSLYGGLSHSIGETYSTEMIIDDSVWSVDGLPVVLPSNTSAGRPMSVDRSVASGAAINPRGGTIGRASSAHRQHVPPPRKRFHTTGRPRRATERPSVSRPGVLASPTVPPPPLPRPSTSPQKRAAALEMLTWPSSTNGGSVSADFVQRPRGGTARLERRKQGSHVPTKEMLFCEMKLNSGAVTFAHRNSRRGRTNRPGIAGHFHRDEGLALSNATSDVIVTTDTVGRKSVRGVGSRAGMGGTFSLKGNGDDGKGFAVVGGGINVGNGDEQHEVMLNRKLGTLMALHKEDIDFESLAICAMGRIHEIGKQVSRLWMRHVKVLMRCWKMARNPRQYEERIRKRFNQCLFREWANTTSDLFAESSVSETMDRHAALVKSLRKSKFHVGLMPLVLDDLTMTANTTQSSPLPLVFEEPSRYLEMKRLRQKYKEQINSLTDDNRGLPVITTPETSRRRAFGTTAVAGGGGGGDSRGGGPDGSGSSNAHGLSPSDQGGLSAMAVRRPSVGAYSSPTRSPSRSRLKLRIGDQQSMTEIGDIRKSIRLTRGVILPPPPAPSTTGQTTPALRFGGEITVKDEPSLDSSIFPQSNSSEDDDEDDDLDTTHLYVFVHGLGAGPLELRLFKNHLAAQMLVEGCLSEFLLIKSIEGLTVVETIEDLGMHVAMEVHEYITNYVKNLGKITFVCHSLGGVIARAAVAHKSIDPYRTKLHTFLSLSSPHLGCIYAQNTLVPSAMWLWQKLSKSPSLKQLSFDDADHLEESYIFKLATTDPLHQFQNILLVCSQQDSVVPFHSARIEVTDDAFGDRKHGSAFLRMVDGIQNPIRSNNSTLVRFDVFFSEEGEKGWEDYVGKAAHAKFLMDGTFIRMFIVCTRKYFL